MKTAALMLALALTLSGCSSARNPDSASGSGKGPAPDFDLENVAGGKTAAADLKGKVLVVDFWATWCEPCIAEIPKFNKMADEYKGNKDVQIVGITVESA